MSKLLGNLAEAFQKAMPSWDPAKHPRDRTGKFIEVGDFVNAFSGPDATKPEKTGQVVASYFAPDGRLFIGVKSADDLHVYWYRPKQLETIAAKAHLKSGQTPSLPIPAVAEKYNDISWDQTDVIPVITDSVYLDGVVDGKDMSVKADNLDTEFLSEIGLGPGVDKPTGSTVPQPDEYPVPAGKTPADILGLMVTSFENKNLHGDDPAVLDKFKANFQDMLNDPDLDSAKKKLAKLMTAAKLGGKQRKRYNSMLVQHHGGKQAMKVVTDSSGPEIPSSDAPSAPSAPDPSAPTPGQAPPYDESLVSEQMVKLYAYDISVDNKYHPMGIAHEGASGGWSPEQVESAKKALLEAWGESGGNSVTDEDLDYANTNLSGIDPEPLAPWEQELMNGTVEPEPAKVEAGLKALYMGATGQAGGMTVKDLQGLADASPIQAKVNLNEAIKQWLKDHDQYKQAAKDAFGGSPATWYDYIKQMAAKQPGGLGFNWAKKAAAEELLKELPDPSKPAAAPDSGGPKLDYPGFLEPYVAQLNEQLLAEGFDETDLEHLIHVAHGGDGNAKNEAAAAVVLQQAYLDGKVPASTLEGANIKLPVGAPPVAAPDTSGLTDPAEIAQAEKTLHLLATTIENKGLHSSQVGLDFQAMLAEPTYEKAAIALNKLMTHAKLGGKQRKRYKDALAKFHGRETPSAAAPAVKKGPPGKTADSFPAIIPSAGGVNTPAGVTGPTKGNKLVNPTGGTGAWSAGAAKGKIQKAISDKLQGRVTKQQLVDSILNSKYQWNTASNDLAQYAQTGKIPAGQRLYKDNVGMWKVGSPGTYASDPGFAKPTEEQFHRALVETVANSLISQWAQTSNDSNARALALQKAAVEEFGLTNTYEWHTNVPGTDQELETHRDLYRSFLRSMYENTQEWAKANGVTHVRLRRGSGVYAGKVGDEVNVQLRPMSSFSTNLSTAQSFGGYRIESIVPIEWVVGTAATGYGCQGEYEWVVLGGVHKARVIS